MKTKKKAKKASNYVFLGVRIPEQQLKWLQKTAAKQGVSVSETLRYILRSQSEAK